MPEEPSHSGLQLLTPSQPRDQTGERASLQAIPIPGLQAASTNTEWSRSVLVSRPAQTARYEQRQCSCAQPLRFEVIC